MPRVPKKSSKSKSSKSMTRRLLLTGTPASAPLDPLRPGMPALDSIHDDKTTFTPTSGGPTYRILKTTETDTYENTAPAIAFRNALAGQKMPVRAALAAADKLSPAKPQAGLDAAAAVRSDNFAGTDRKAAKTSVATAKTQTYNDVSQLIATLPSLDQMVKLKIPQDSASNRVSQENRNVHITGFLFASSREADNDFHLIVGLDPKVGKETYMTMEVSGLPPKSDPAFAALNKARTAFKQFFQKPRNLPGAGYHFYQPPIPVQADGSLFFDVKHSTGQSPGPPSLKSRMPTIWEIHPVTNIKLGP
jgi:hypothetical protein